MFLRHSLFGLALLLIWIQARAQELHFQHLTADDGLSDNAITCLYEDRDGFLWIGTEHGLNKYDGTTVHQVSGAEASITAVLEDGSGSFWITTKDKGLLLLDGSSGVIRNFSREQSQANGLVSNKLTALFDLNDTTLLIGSSEVALVFLDKRSFHFSYWTDSTSISPARAAKVPANSRGWCHALVPLGAEHLWVGLLNSHLSLIADRRTGRIVHHLSTFRQGSETQTNALLLDNTLYTGGWQNGIDAAGIEGLFSEGAEEPFGTRVIDVPDEVTAMIPWTGDAILAATRQSGLYTVSTVSGIVGRTARDRSDPSSLSSDRVRCMLHDRSGTLWLGTAAGVEHYVPGTWAFNVEEVFGDPKSDQPDVLFHRIEGTDGDGLRIFSSEGFFLQDSMGAELRHVPFDHEGRPVQPTVMAEDHNGTKLVGTEYGIARMEDHGPAVGAFAPFDGVAQTYAFGTMYQVRGLAPDTLEGRPVFVIATLGFGAQVMDASTHRILGAAMPEAATKVNTHSLVNGMLQDKRGRYWFFSAGGLYHWERSDPLTLVPTKTALPSVPSDILANGEDVRQAVLLNDTLWAVTRSGALLRAVNNGLDRHAPPTWMHSAMHGLTADRAGHLWITTDNGLLRFGPADGSFTRIPVNDGRRFRKLTGAITMLADGRIAFCADNALLTFRPEAFDRLPMLPLAYLTRASAAGNELRVHNGEVQLSYRSSVIDIGLSALARTFPEPLAFNYRLEGVEDHWRAVEAGEAIRYAGIPVGTHRLLVQIEDAFGRRGPEQVLLLISVSAPFWQQWWFYAVAAVLVTIGVLAWSRYRIGHALKLQAVRNRIASDLHDEVGSSLSSITIGSQLASQLSSQENEQVKLLMARIGQTSSESLRSMSDIVWAIDPKNDEGIALVKRMHRIANELLESKGVDVSFSVSGGVEELKLPMNARKEILLIYKEAVHNASKYAGAGSVQVSLHRRDGSLAMSVKDDGKGFDLALHPDGHGLGSMRRRATSLGTTLSLTSAPGMGTLIGVEVDLTRIRD